MLGAIAGDVAGSRFEGDPAPPADFDLFHPDCRFTDDTVCTLAVAEAAISGKPFDEVLRAFVRAHPDRGYGGMFVRWAFQDDAGPYGSWGNGAPMRVAAVGWLARDEHEALRLAEAQAAVSHNHPDAVAAAQAVALAIHLINTGTDLGAVRSLIEERFSYVLDAAKLRKGAGFDITATGTVAPALAAALASSSWEDAVRTVIGLGGDTDTLACIAGSVAEAIHGLPNEFASKAESYLTPDLKDVVDRFRSHIAVGRI